MGTFGKCEKVTVNPILVLEEEKSRMVFKNPTRQPIRLVRVDGCLPIEGIKCDFLLIDSKQKEHFVELKGADIRHAANQLWATVSQISSNPQRSEKHCFVVSTRCPLLTPEIQNLKKRFKQQFNSTLTIKNKLCEHTVD